MLKNMCNNTHFKAFKYFTFITKKKKFNLQEKNKINML